MVGLPSRWSGGNAITGTVTMAERIVLDASSAIAIVRHEADGPDVRRLLSDELTSDLWVTAFFWLEVANSLMRRHRQAAAQVLEAIASLDDLDLQTADSDRPAVLASFAVASKHGLSVYDASYLALAERLDASLLTLDARLAAAAGDRALSIRRRGRRVQESKPAYQLRPWVRWSELDRYVEAVREVTIASAR